MKPASSCETSCSCPDCEPTTSRPPLAASLWLLGGWRLEVEGRHLVVQRSVQRLLAFVALHRRCTRDLVAGQLWPECSESRAHGNLRSTLWRTHQLPHGLVAEHSDGLWIAPSVEVDVELLRHGAHSAVDGGHSTPALAADDARDNLLGHDLLPGWYDEWVLVERERLRQLQLHALESLARRLASSARYSDAIDVAMLAMAAEPVRESAHRIVIEVHLAEGNYGEALRAYETLRRILATELGVEPSGDLTARVRRPAHLGTSRPFT